MKKFLKIILAILITTLGIFSVLFTMPFSRSTVNIGLEGVIVGIVLVVYALFTSYLGSILALIASFLVYSRKVIWFLAISYIVYFILILNNLIIFVGGGSKALILFIPLILYAASSFRLFRKLAKGRL